MFRRSAGPSGVTPADPDGFSDEFGHRREVDRPFLIWRRFGRSRPAPPAAIADGGEISPDARLWHAATTGADVHGLIAPSDIPRPLFPHRAVVAARPDDPDVFAGNPPAIEVWTEMELCALHALWWIGRRRQDARLIARADMAATWHLENLQPDNATNHPWAVHAFAEFGERRGSPEADLHAQTLLHNCRVALGRPDALSAQILGDAADAIDSLLLPGPG
ncbi:MAG: hypothetical protein IBJ11_00685 [Phycisphaerales bacterium]|nr:hypothetical protein [Phycisphaerales bacterium]